MKLTKPLTLTRVGEHYMDGGLYQDAQGSYYVDHFSPVESGKVNVLSILSPRTDPYGEPNSFVAGVILLTNPPSEREKLVKRYEYTLMMLSRLKSDGTAFFSPGDCRYHTPQFLWGGNIRGLIQEMRDQYSQLPDEIKDVSPLTQEQINRMAERLEGWADKEFSKPKYDPVPPTPYEQYHGLVIKLDESLHYTDDEGQIHTPTHVYFSSDLRRWHHDETAVHGRAFTTYLGQKGTVMAPVWQWDDLQKKQYRRSDLCEVSCKYDDTILHWRLYNFYHE